MDAYGGRPHITMDIHRLLPTYMPTTSYLHGHPIYRRDDHAHNTTKRVEAIYCTAARATAQHGSDRRLFPHHRGPKREMFRASKGRDDQLSDPTVL